MPRYRKSPPKKKQAPPLVKFTLVPYERQRDILAHVRGEVKNPEGDNYRFIVVVMGRQSGKSWMARYEALDAAINRHHTVMWVAPTIPSARSHWNMIVKLIKQSGLPIESMNRAEKEIHFIGGGSISIRSVIDPDNIRGPSLDLLILDEAAFFRNGRYVWFGVCQPMITASRGQVMILTTPNGRNWVYDIWKKGMEPGELNYKSFRATAMESPYQDKKLLRSIRDSMPEVQWREEYLAEFLADGSGIFTNVEQQATIEALSGPLPGHRYAAGIDFGFKSDATCFTVIDIDTKQQVFGKRWVLPSRGENIDALKALLDQWQPTVTYIERNGIGQALLLWMQQRFNQKVIDEVGEVQLERQYTVGGHRIVGIHMDNAVKREMVERLAADIEFDRLKLLAPTGALEGYSDIQISEMSTYIRKPTQSGMDITYKAEEGSNDDTVSALYLALRGVPKKAVVIQTRFTNQRRNPFKRRVA